MATETSETDAAIGFGLECPVCGQDALAMTIDLNALGRATCADCGEEFDPLDTAEKLATNAAKWRAVARWIGQAEAWVGAAGGEGEAQS